MSTRTAAWLVLGSLLAYAWARQRWGDALLRYWKEPPQWYPQ